MLNRLLHECFDLFHNREDRSAIDTAAAEEIMPSATPGEGAPVASIAVNSVINASGNSGGTTSLNITNHNRTITSVNNNHYGSGASSIQVNGTEACLGRQCWGS